MDSILLRSTAEPGASAVASGVNIGFKDWAVVCDALGSGRQSLILRKGGIAEGRDGFRFKHERFFLFPTGYHQQLEKVRPEEMDGLASESHAPTEEIVAIRYLFDLEFAHWVSDWETLARLERFHIWRDDVVRERFEYEDARGLQCAFGRVYRQAVPWTFPNRPAYGGCRSWVTLPAPPASLSQTPVLDDAEHDRRRNAILEILDLA